MLDPQPPSDARPVSSVTDPNTVAADNSSEIWSGASDSSYTAVSTPRPLSQEVFTEQTADTEGRLATPAAVYIQSRRKSQGPSPLAQESSSSSNEEITMERTMGPSRPYTLSGVTLPVGTPSYPPACETPTLDNEKSEKPGQGVADNDDDGPLPGQTTAAKLSIGTRLYYAFRRTYCPRVEPPMVLPTCPTDEEKRLYVHTNRIPLYVFGVFSFLSLCAGMWLFTLSAAVFSWYGVFATLMAAYLAVSYYVGIIGRDWDEAGHVARLAEFPITDETAPTVDIYLPCCREPLEILANTYRHVARLDWPAAKLRVHVMDDGADSEVESLARKHGFEYGVRGDRPRLRKAGNLRWTFARTTGDFFVIFDADFCPRPDFVRELMVEHLADPRTAIVQTPQFFRVTDRQTWVEQGAGATQELFYRVVQVNRDRWGASICVGSNALYRREALVAVGGTAEIGFSEDVHTGFGAVDRSWKVKYVPLCLATGVCPNSPRAFFSQQMRWARGSTTLLTNPHFWVSSLTLMQKICYLSGFLYYVAVSINIFLAPIAGTLLLAVRPEWFRYWNLAFAIPSILYGVIVMRIWARASYGFNVQHCMTIMSYAYLTAIKDRLLGIELLWSASGDAKVHSTNTKYRNMRWLCIVWTVVVTGAMVGVVTWRLVMGLAWYHTIPLIVITCYNLFINHYFMACNW